MLDNMNFRNTYPPKKSVPTQVVNGSLFENLNNFIYCKQLKHNIVTVAEKDLSQLLYDYGLSVCPSA